MILTAIVLCEIGFWVLLGAGLATRYLLRRPRAGALLLVGVPVVDVALLLFTVLDLRSGTPADSVHGLAALYLGVSIAFGPSLVRWADERFAHRFAGGPQPTKAPRPGTWARAVKEWRDFGRACVAGAISAVLLLGAIVLVGDRSDTAPLWQLLPLLGLVLAVWLVGWPVVETARALPARLASSRDGRRTDP